MLRLLPSGPDRVGKAFARASLSRADLVAPLVRCNPARSRGNRFPLAVFPAKTTTMTKRGYHHGNLKQALVEAALTLIADRGPHGFTMAEASKLADVSAAAPYRHFTGREDLITEMAYQGFELFADLLEYAYKDGQPSPLAAFEAVGRAYLAFARAHPGHYVAMFESGISPRATSELATASARANGVLLRAAADLSGAYPRSSAPSHRNVRGAYLCNEPRDRGTSCAWRAGCARAVFARGSVGIRYRHIPTGSGSAGAG